jgi:bifunctional non-homologous end joining protein LigD
MSTKKPTMRMEGMRLTSPDRVLFEEQGVTKRELAEYFRSVADHILPHLAGRPLTLIRCPRGRGEKCFVQRRASESFPDVLRRVDVPEEEGSATYLVADSLPALIALVQLGVLELHTWSARRDRLDRPDRMVLDLDPAPDLPFSAVVGAAREIRERLDALGLDSFVKTSGGKGVHLVVPLVRRHSWDEVRGFARALAEEMERRAPDRFLASSAKAERGGKIFIDYLRNAWSASVVAAYSSRARPGAPVSVPLDWEELTTDLSPAELNVRTVPERLARMRRDPWRGFDQARQWLKREAREAIGG